MPRRPWPTDKEGNGPDHPGTVAREVILTMYFRNTCSIYVKFGKKKVKIPVNPEEPVIQRPTNHKKYEVLGLGEIVVPKKPSLKTVSWECFFPQDTGASYVNSGAREPEYYVDFFEKALEKEQVGRLVITRSGSYDTNMKCLVASFETKDRGGEPGDVYYSLELEEYRPYGPETLAVITAPAAADSPEVEISAQAPRAVETPVLRAGAQVMVNGEYCYDSQGSRPHGTAANLSTTVTRIVPGSPFPVHVGHYGWVREEQLQITG